MNTVGKSSGRTPLKHEVLNRHLGKIVGVLSNGSSRVPAKANPFLAVDMCAGDGSESDGYSTSPSIINRHCKFLQAKYPCNAVFIEKDQYTFAELYANVRPEDWTHKVELRHEDARLFRVQPTSKHQAIFVNADPNSISHMPLCDEFMSSLTETTTMTMTMGCNAAGLKRLPRENREEWYEYMIRAVANMPRYHDAIIVRLKQDSAQWAYFSRLPILWAADHVKELQKIGDKSWPKGVDIVRLSDGRQLFTDMLNQLFLTKQEYYDVR
jgi:hypothetical protein